MGGGKGRSSAEQQSAIAAQTQARIAEQMFQEATPLRGALFGSQPTPAPGLIGEILQPRTVEPIADLTRSIVRPATQAGIDTARQNILRTVPRGGLQRRLLADVERSAIEQLATQEAEFAIGDIGRREAAEEQRAGRIFQAAAPALGASQIGVTGLGSSAATLGQLGAAQSARSSRAKAGAGQLAGTLVGSALGGPFGGALGGAVFKPRTG